MKIHDLKLNESIENNGMKITRVPGGWIYTQYQHFTTKAGNLTSCFVPYNKEFQG